ncbi:MAG: carbon-nitrogen hydrolase family protein [Kiritimatiellae bacterium]|nr:carbon-nitrogen hydrolase family protein [Kiritimatiellia bacterium]
MELVPSVVDTGGPRLALAAAEPWAPHARAAVVTARRDGAFAADANGTRTCAGGWQWRFEGIVPGRTYALTVEMRHQGLAAPRDMLRCVAAWGAPAANQDRYGTLWEYLLPSATGPDAWRFARTSVGPAGACQLTIRATLRWTAVGKTLWEMPRVAVAAAPLTARPPVRVCAVTGHSTQRQGRSFKTLADNLTFYGQLCEAACGRDHPQLIVLPEIALQWGVPGHPLDVAVPASGPEIEAFAELVRRHRVRIAVGMYERDSDAVYNSLILISPAGRVDGRYRKVHLASCGEDTSGLLPGDGFPVFETEVGRLGCNICMDGSAAESTRLVGLNGADLLLYSVMGDHRADRFSRGSPIFSEDRWRAIARTHAIDNQVCMAVARNGALGSGIVDRKGEWLVWNDGDLPFVTADVLLDDAYRVWNGSTFRDVAWYQRRPHLYGAFTDPGNFGSLR